MWRSFFLGIGVSMCLLGAEGLVVDRAILRADQMVFKSTPQQPTATAAPREFVAPEWAPWSFLSAGAVVIIYSLTLARGGGSG